MLGCSGQAITGKEIFTFGSHLGPAADDTICSGQAAQQQLAIPLGDDPAVQRGLEAGDSWIVVCVAPEQVGGF